MKSTFIIKNEAITLVPGAKEGQMTLRQAAIVFYENITDFAKLINDAKDNVLIRLEGIKCAQ